MKPLCDVLLAVQECDIGGKALRSDSGGKHRTSKLVNICQQIIIKQALTVPYNSEGDDISDCIDRTLIEMSRWILSQAKGSKVYWCEAMIIVVDIRNAHSVQTRARLSSYTSSSHAFTTCALLAVGAIHTCPGNVGKARQLRCALSATWLLQVAIFVSTAGYKHGYDRNFTQRDVRRKRANDDSAHT